MRIDITPETLRDIVVDGIAEALVDNNITPPSRYAHHALPEARRSFARDVARPIVQMIEQHDVADLDF